MKKKALFLALATLSTSLFSADNEQLQQEIRRLQQQTKALQTQLNAMQKQLITNSGRQHSARHAVSNSKNTHRQEIRKQPGRTNRPAKPAARTGKPFHSSPVSAHLPDNAQVPALYYPTALIADNKVITYIAGTPVVTSPYTGERPAFDGSDHIVNISSINRDVRLMEQRRRIYKAYRDLGYVPPRDPILALSGKSEPVAVFSDSYAGNRATDLSLGSTELDVMALLNQYVEAFISFAYDDSPPEFGGPRVTNSSIDLNLGFVNIGNLEKSPIYFTAGQLYAPFGRYSSSMISSPITLRMARTKTRPFILGYKSQTPAGPYAAVYGFTSEITNGGWTIGGYNLGYTINSRGLTGDIGVGVIGTIADSQGMQLTGSTPYTTFGGFGSITNGSEAIGRVPGLDIHGNISFSRYSLTAEWVGATHSFNPQDLSFNGTGAQPQAAQLEAGVTFRAFNKPASLAMGYQWSKDTLALNLPEHRFSGVFNISIWKDTVESIEYRHDEDFSAGTYANGAAAPGQVNANTIGTGGSADTVIAQIGVYF